MTELAPQFESGALRPPTVGEQFPFSDATKAYERVASGKGGKVVLIFN